MSATEAPERPQAPTDPPTPGQGSSDRPASVDASDEAVRDVDPLVTSVAAFLAAAAAAWMAAGVFRGVSPRVLGLAGAALGAGMVGLSYRTSRPAVLQYLALPAALLLGAVVIIPDASGGTANLPALVAEAIRGGGLGQPPAPFEPGWKVLLILLSTVAGAGAAAIGVGMNRPKLGILLPVPIIFGGALLQPPGAVRLSSVVALALAIGAMSVAFGVDLANEGASSGEFELRRLGRGAAMLAALVAALLGLSQLGFLFPDSDADQYLPPKRPEQVPPEADRELFTVTSPVDVPWRLGTLDVYQDNAWMTPPFRSSRLAPVGEDGAIPFRGATGDELDSTVVGAPSAGSGETFTATFTVSDLTGNVVPSVLTATAVPSTDVLVEYDPRTQMLHLPGGRPRRGTTYSITAPVPPSGLLLAEAPPPPDHLAEYLEVPEPPPGVRRLLRDVPDVNTFDQLQFVRDAFYQSVVAAGAGAAVDVPPERVDEMLRGEDASPYEITAGEVLLARWVGVPARMGFGYYGGERVEGSDDTYSLRPRNGATWLEAYFEGHGWVPIVGVPPQAKASLSDDEKNEDDTVRATDELALILYVPIKLQSITLLFELVRFWAVRVLPALLAVALVVGFYPGVVKIARRGRRRRWAQHASLRDRVLVAYADYRDMMNDFNFGDPVRTPLEFVDDVAVDAEHEELAWLVTRVLWGDLVRDVREQDVVAAEEMAASVARRVRQANGGLPRVLAFGSRASLRDPYSRDVPNLWPQRRRRASRRGERWHRAALRRLRRRLRRLTASSTALLALLAATLSGCVQTIDLSAAAEPVGLPAALAPAEIDGLELVREPAVEAKYEEAAPQALVQQPRVFSIHEGQDVQGSVQIAAFKPGLADRSDDARRGVIRGIGTGLFELTRIGNERVYKLELAEQDLLLWFPPSDSYYQLMVTRKEFQHAERLFVKLLAFQQGRPLDEVEVAVVRPLDPRRGIKE